jgi:hypothetical protein
MNKAEGKRQKAEGTGKRHAAGLSLVFCLLPFAFCLFFSSCATLPEMPWAPPARDASAGFYDTARLEYRLDAGKLGQPLDVVRVDGRTVRYEQVASSPLAEQSIGTLVIQYPHPAGKSGLARVTYSLDSGRPNASRAEGLNPFHFGQSAAAITPGHEEIHEVWAMDIDRAESSRLFELLTRQNFYHSQEKQGGVAELAVTIDGKQIRKRWEQVAELNHLALRVRRDGQLVALLRPAALSGSPDGVIANTMAFREALARAGAPTHPAPASPGGPGTPQVARLP